MTIQIREVFNIEVLLQILESWLLIAIQSSLYEKY